jgi:hypothetical protein
MCQSMMGCIIQLIGYPLAHETAKVEEPSELAIENEMPHNPRGL